MVDSRVDPQRVHPVPEGSLLPGFTWTETSGRKSKSNIKTTPRYVPPPSVTFKEDFRDGAQTFDGAPVDVLVLRFLQSRVLVEQIGNKSQVQFGVATDDVRRHDELSAPEAVGLVQHALGPLQVLFLLPRDGRGRRQRSVLCDITVE